MVKVYEGVPNGYVHVRGTRLQPLCRKLGLPYADAVVDWSGWRGLPWPVKNGVVVEAGDEESLREAMDARQARAQAWADRERARIARLNESTRGQFPGWEVSVTKAGSSLRVSVGLPGGCGQTYLETKCPLAREGDWKAYFMHLLFDNDGQGAVGAHIANLVLGGEEGAREYAAEIVRKEASERERTRQQKRCEAQLRTAKRESRAWFGRVDCEFRRSNSHNIVFQVENAYEVAADPVSHRLYEAHDWPSLVEHWRTLPPTNSRFREKLAEVRTAEVATSA